MQPGDYVFLYQKADVGYDTGRRLLLWKSGPTLPVTPLLAQRGAGLFQVRAPTRLRNEIAMTEIAGLLAGVLLPWVAGFALVRMALARTGESDPWVEAGYGHFAGVLLVTLLLRVQDLAGMPLAFAADRGRARARRGGGLVTRPRGASLTTRATVPANARRARDPLARGRSPSH